ncbi:MAG: hypothetical protein V1678_00670 [Candidatus Aenigmatarchaeota archaeon]
MVMHKKSKRNFILVLLIIATMIAFSSQADALVRIVSTYIDMLGNDIYNVGNLNATGWLNSTNFNGTYYGDGSKLQSVNTFNSTYDAKPSNVYNASYMTNVYNSSYMTNVYNASYMTSTYNSTYDGLFTTNNVSNNSLYLGGLAAASYATDRYNASYMTNVYNASYMTNTFNSTYDAKPDSVYNASYMTNTFNVTYDEKPSSTYNSTYDTWAYNQTTPAITSANTYTDAKVASQQQTFLPTTILTIAGVLDSGDISSINVSEDSVSYNISEVATDPPIDVRINFSEVQTFNKVSLREYYKGSSTHIITIQLYNWLTSAWVNFGVIADQSDFYYAEVNVPNSTDYINATNGTSLRLLHSNGGSTFHDFFIDYAALRFDGSGTSVTSHDSLLNRDDSNNHPWAMPKSTAYATFANLSVGNVSNNSLYLGGLLASSYATDRYNASYFVTSPTNTSNKTLYLGDYAAASYFIISAANVSNSTNYFGGQLSDYYVNRTNLSYVMYSITNTSNNSLYLGGLAAASYFVSNAANASNNTNFLQGKNGNYYWNTTGGIPYNNLSLANSIVKGDLAQTFSINLGNISGGSVSNNWNMSVYNQSYYLSSASTPTCSKYYNGASLVWCDCFNSTHKWMANTC